MDFPDIMKSNEDYSLMFDNYMTYLMADTIQALTPSGWYQWLQQTMGCQYIDWIANMRTNLQNSGIQTSPIYNRILALLYINTISLDKSLFFICSLFFSIKVYRSNPISSANLLS